VVWAVLAKYPVRNRGAGQESRSLLLRWKVLLRYFNKRTALIVLRIVSFLALIPVSFRIVDRLLFTQAFHPGWEHPVLLVWSDHVEMKWFRNVSEVSPRPESANYTFNVAPERQAWVEEQVRSTPNRNADWFINVKQLGSARQQIELGVLGDGVRGIIYEATPKQIVPLHSKITGPAGALPVFVMNLLLWGGIWWAASFIRRSTHRRKLQTAEASR
jgi:hypothetical protein